MSENENRVIDRTEFIRSRDRILSRFSIAFTKKVNTNPMYHAVYCMLQQGVDEYRIIEELLQNNEQLGNDIIKLKENSKPNIYVNHGRK
jgi:hypothetical protein